MLNPEAHGRTNATGKIRHQVRIRYKIDIAGTVEDFVLVRERGIIIVERYLNESPAAKSKTIPAGNVSIPKPVAVGFIADCFLVGRTNDLTGCGVLAVPILHRFVRMDPVVLELDLQSVGTIDELFNFRFQRWPSFLHNLREEVRLPQTAIQPVCGQVGIQLVGYLPKIATVGSRKKYTQLRRCDGAHSLPWLVRFPLLGEVE